MLRIIFFLCVLIMAPSLSAAMNHVYLDIVKTGEDKGADTLFVGQHYEARLFISNDVQLRQLQIAMRFWGGIVGKDDKAEAGHFWDWLDVGGYGATTACVKVVPGSRMDPPSNVWDSEFAIVERDVNENSPDTLVVRGTADAGGMAAGSSQHMISIHFIPRMPTYGMIMMWGDTAHVSPGGGLVFYDMGGTPIYPTFSSPGQWPIALVCGDANGDGSVNVGDAVFLISYVFKGGAAPIPVCAGDANGDGGTNVGDAVYMISYVFKGGAPPLTTCCP